MKTKFLKKLLVIFVIFTIGCMISMGVNAQTIEPIDFSAAYYYPVWSLVGIGAPWWAIAVAEQPIQPVGFQWPGSMITPYSTGLELYGIKGFSGIGLTHIQPTCALTYQGFSEMCNVPPGFGLSLGLGMGAFGGLGINHFGSPNAITTMGIPWNWQPFFGLTSISPGPFYLGMFSPWWATQQPLNAL